MSYFRRFQKDSIKEILAGGKVFRKESTGEWCRLCSSCKAVIYYVSRNAAIYCERRHGCCHQCALKNKPRRLCVVCKQNRLLNRFRDEKEICFRCEDRIAKGIPIEKIRSQAAITASLYPQDYYKSLHPIKTPVTASWDDYDSAKASIRAGFILPDDKVEWFMGILKKKASDKHPEWLLSSEERLALRRSKDKRRNHAAKSSLSTTYETT